jgi:vancomycin permeability regulator SanA
MNWVVFSKSYDKNITAETAIVFGAAVTPEKEPSTILRLRLEKSRQLFLENKIKTIIVSGSKGDYYNEPTVMKNYLIEKGIPENVILKDESGFRTLETCRQAAQKFQVTKAIIITQNFHLPRSSFLCSNLGIEVIPSTALNSSYNSTIYGTIREIGACLLAIWDSLSG